MNKIRIKTPIIKKANNTSFGEFVQIWLRDAIKTGQCPPGNRIKETEVASRLIVSRKLVREAFGRLQADDLLVMTLCYGAQFAELNRNQVIKLYAILKTLKGTAAMLAAQHARKSEVAFSLKLLEQGKFNEDNILNQVKINCQFHLVLYEAAHNRYLLKALNALSNSLSLLRSTTYEVFGRAATAQLQQIAIASAIKKRVPIAAEKAACSHIKAAEQVRIQLLFGKNENLGPNFFNGTI